LAPATPVSLARRKLDQLERMAVWVPEIPGRDAGRGGVPGWQALRHGGGGLGTGSKRQLLRGQDVLNNQGHVAEHRVVAGLRDRRIIGLPELNYRRADVQHRPAWGRQAQERCIESSRARHVADGQCDARALHAHHDKRPRMWSATRKALAMMVSVGFTAPLLGKKLPSTT